MCRRVRRWRCGFGLSGAPNVLIEALYERGVSGLSVVSNNCGAMESGLAVLLAAGLIGRVMGLVMSGRTRSSRGSMAGSLEVELIPQGTLAERLRAGGAGIPAFYTPPGWARRSRDGGLPWRYDGSGRGGAGLARQGGARVRGHRVRAGARHPHRLRAGPGPRG